MHYNNPQDRESALFTAACEGNVNIVKMLVDYGAIVDLSNKVVFFHLTAVENKLSYRMVKHL